MISVVNRDARKGVGLGFPGGGGGGGGGRREMEETELEEGEACSYQKISSNNNDDYDASIDPDVALSYIDEKLQDVLGHFQKDFEGGVSAENLGAKFGGYGSFLPSYHRSPVWSHPKTPPKVQNYNAARSPNNLQTEGGHYNSVAPSTAPRSARLAPSSTSATTVSSLKVPSARAEESAPRYEAASKKSSNLTDQKTLKVRIKVGSDNLSTRKNAAIYSGLGLDVSPSSSLDDSLSESEGMSHEPQDAPCESPTSILRIMTSFPVHGDLLLSPLPDNLFQLTRKEKILKDGKSVLVTRGDQESSAMLVNGPDFVKGEDIVLEEKNGSSKDAWKGKQEVDIDTTGCEELVSNMLKLPLISNTHSKVNDMANGLGRAPDISRESSKGVVRDKILPDLPKRESLEPTSTQEIGWVDKPKGGSSGGKVWEDKRASSFDDVSVYQKKDGHSKGEKGYDLVKADSIVSKGTKALNADLLDPPKQKVNQRAASLEQDNIAPHKENQCSVGKKKSKGSHSTLAIEVPKESLRVGSSTLPKNSKSTPVDYETKSELANFKLQKDAGRAKDTYRDFFGDIESEQEENQLDLLEMPAEEVLKDSEVVEKSETAINNASKDRSSKKKVVKPATSVAYPKMTTNVAPCAANGTISDSVPPAVAPVVIEENWVCCDKCQKWRLLPLGTNPDNLPEKWLCTMLNWLPGMNRCSVSEEETTKAVKLAENQTNLQCNPGGVISGVKLTDIQQLAPNHQNFGLHAIPGGGKKKHGLKEISNSTNSPTQFSNSTKKNLQASEKCRSLNDVNQSPRMSEPELKLSRSSDLALDKHKHKKEKHKVNKNCFDGGDTKNSKMKSKRDPDQDFFRASKKLKNEGVHCTHEDWMSDHGGAIMNVGPSSNRGLPTTSAGKDLPNHNDRSMTKDTEDRLQVSVNDRSMTKDTEDRLQVSVKRTKDKVQVPLEDGSLNTGNYDSKDVTRKRKDRECQDTRVNLESHSSKGHHLQGTRAFSKEEFSENDYRKEKKAKVSKSEGKESSANKGNGRSDKKGSHTKNRQLRQDIESTLSQRSLDGMDLLKRDLGSVQPSVAATSSSSKVSGSHKTKASFQEVKGSPVESVSSSPMRISNPDKLTSTKRKLKGKVDSRDAVFIRSPRRSSDGEDDGGSDRSGTARKDKTFTVGHRGSLESSMLDFQDRNFNHLLGSKAKAQILPSPNITDHHLMNSDVDKSGQDNQYSNKPQASDRGNDGEQQSENPSHANGSYPRKSGKGSSSRSKEKNRSYKSEFGTKISDSLNNLQDHAPYRNLKTKDDRNMFPEKLGDKSDETEYKHSGAKESAGKLSSDNTKRESQSNFGRHDSVNIKLHSIGGQDAMATPNQNLLQNCDGERSSKRVTSDKTVQVENVPGRGKSLPLAPSEGSQNGSLIRCPRQVPAHKENGGDILSLDASERDDAPKVTKQTRKVDNQHGTQHMSLRYPTPNGHRVRDLDAPSSIRRDSSSQSATNALKEAKDLKHLADRIKNGGSNFESTSIYFEAALKFLHGASLLESSNSENVKHGEMIQSIQIYRDTAKLCGFCAHEYEKLKDMSAAALAYKCMEVAYMRVIYSSNTSANRDRNELQSALQMVPPGESPSSSASDIDNLNNPATMDRVSLPKGVSSPQVAGNHVIAARNRPNFVRLLNFAQDVNFAMEASKKSRIAFATAKNVSLGEAQHREGISSIERALDFNFQDVEGLLGLVKLAMEAIGR